MNGKQLFAALLLALLLPASIALAHPGRTDKYGGHWNHSTGTYHYHNGSGSSGSSSNGSGKSSSSKPAKPMIDPEPSEGLLTTGNVNMRNGAGTSYSIITTLPAGTSVTHAGHTSGRWHYVKYGTSYGWVYNDYLKIDASRPAPTQEPYEPYLEFASNIVDAVYKSAAAEKEGKPAVLTFELGFLISIAGLIATVIIAVRIAKKGIRNAEETARRQVASAQEDVSRAKANTSRELAALDAKHKAEMAERRELQMNFLKTREIVGALETVASPDLSEGIVFVRPDLMLGAYYHHSPICTSELSSVLITKTAAKRMNMYPCPRCCDLPAPEHDFTVYITDSNYSALQEGKQLTKTIVYHRANCRHLYSSYSSRSNVHAIALSELENSGFQTSICADCAPPLCNLHVWF